MEERNKEIERPELIVFERIDRKVNLEYNAIRALIRINSIKDYKKLNNIIIYSGIALTTTGIVISRESFSSGFIIGAIGAIIVMYFMRKNKALTTEQKELLKQFNTIISEFAILKNMDITKIDLVHIDDNDFTVESTGNARKLKY